MPDWSKSLFETPGNLRFGRKIGQRHLAGSRPDYGPLLVKKSLKLKKGDAILKTIFPFKTEQLLIIGRIEITSAAINLLMRHRINTVFLHRNGRFNGRLTIPPGKKCFFAAASIPISGR
ncbi:MAG: CRISPR-associated endonuclease Cas1 [Deltaproteobacteria bacterium]|nr:CRISPR-associated endonuclease Cas1 [Deltaproteobacteria bacterium]